MSFYYLETIKGNQKGRRYLVLDGAISIGRSSQNTIALPASEKAVSGHHAIIYKSPERILIQDLNSTNGTFVNEEKITEKDLIIGDVIGFGKTGPRLKLIISEQELDTTNIINNDSIEEQTAIKTNEEVIPLIITREATSNEDRKSVSKLSEQYQNLTKEKKEISKTIEYEQKMINKSINQNDMKNLMKDEKRIEKIIKRGKIGETQIATLRSAYKVHKSMKRQWYYLITAIIFISIIFSSYFGIRSFQYKNIVDKAKNIKKDLEKYENEISVAINNPKQNKKLIESLIKKIEEKQKSLSSLKEKMDEEDFIDFYSDPLEKRINEILSRFGETDYYIPREMIERVRYHIENYKNNLNSAIKRYLKRKDKFFPMIQEIFREKNLPIELAYISMLESGFNPMALSHAGARGLWQFMPKTARQYGLKVNENIDERIDPIKSTYAAAEYLKDLIGIFGGKSSVMLCMAAYNAGEGRVMEALKKIDDPMRNRDFWYIYRMGFLAKETNEYIPQVIAFILISENPNDYGFGDYNINIKDTTTLETEKDFIEFNYTIE